MKLFRQGRLTREIALILAVKLVLIITIKLVYFSDARKPGSEGVAQALLSQNPSWIQPQAQSAPERNATP